LADRAEVALAYLLALNNQRCKKSKPSAPPELPNPNRQVRLRPDEARHSLLINDPHRGRMGFCSLDCGTGSVPALRVAVIEGYQWFWDHAEQQTRRIAHHLPGVSLLHSPGAKLLQPGYFGRQVVSVDIDMNPG